MSRFVCVSVRNRACAVRHLVRVIEFLITNCCSVCCITREKYSATTHAWIMSLPHPFRYECVVDAGHVSGKISDLYRISLTGLLIFSAFGKLE